MKLKIIINKKLDIFIEKFVNFYIIVNLYIIFIILIIIYTINLYK